ncbi:MAG: hypothetical protein ACPGJU_01840 [Coraliomargarita sp.]
MDPHTDHAPANRASWDELHAQMSALIENPALQEQVQNTSEQIMLLNPQRQIVYANTACVEMLGSKDPAELYACRPGEALKCVHAGEGLGGCGTSINCQLCGGVNAVLNSLKGKVDVQQCTIEQEDSDTPLQLILFTMPIYVKDRQFVLVSMLDQSSSMTQTSALAKHAFAVQNLAAAIEHAA